MAPCGVFKGRAEMRSLAIVAGETASACATLLHGVSELFLAQLDDHELAVLEKALDKVTVDCTFG